jgi:hypothetical protein
MEKVRTSSLLRAGGVAAAVLLPDRTGRAARGAVTGGSYALSSVVDPDGIQVLSVDLDDERFPAWVNQAFPQATAVASWVLVTQVLVPAVRLLPVPRALAAVALGGAVYAADAALARTVREARARAAATPDPEPVPNG